VALNVTVPRSTRGYPPLSALQAEEATEWQATTSESVTRKLPPIDDAQDHDGSEEAEIGWVFRVLSKLVLLNTFEITV
jgi:hypothetical protein